RACVGYGPLGGEWTRSPLFGLDHVPSLIGWQHGAVRLRRSPVHVAITGAHGLIGGALTRSLEADGHEVSALVRPGSDRPGIEWDPARGTIDVARLEGLDAVVHLAGEGIATHRWTAAQKQRILRSRVDGTRLLAGALAKLERPPSVFLSGSAIGFYGSRGGELLDESSTPGHDFIAEVCEAWEGATAAAESAGIRTVRFRTGIVLSTEDGILGKQLVPFRLGLGGRAGDGTQWLSWISLPDEVGALRHAIEHQELSGPVNLTAPRPVTNREFTKALGRAVHRPTLTVIPRAVRRLPAGIGPLADMLLFTSSRVAPDALLGSGYRFQHPDLATALAALLP
ncbi:MAG TPA: TIGR01777 family oxidoreductase, partial [Acidimicrobiales bacterium]